MKVWQASSLRLRLKLWSTIQAVRENLQSKNLHKFEAACLANLCPDNYEEAKALIPSLEVCFVEIFLFACFSFVHFAKS